MEESWEISQQLTPQTSQDYFRIKEVKDDIDHLRDSVAQLEEQVARGKRDNQVLTAKLEQAQDELDRSYKYIENTKTKEANYTEKIQLLENKLGEISRSGAAPESSHRFRSELDRKTEEVVNLQVQLSQRENQLQAFSQSQGVNVDRLKELEGELEMKQAELENIQGRLYETEKAIDELCLNKPSEGAVYLELEQLRADNKKLLSMLRKTGGKAFAQFVEDSGGNARYIPPRKKTRSCSARKQQQECAEQTFDDWIPDEAFKIAHSVMAKNQGVLSESVISSLLSELNRIWSEREAKQIARLKKRYTEEITKLKRQSQMKAPYSNVELNKQNARLRYELQEANKQITANTKPTKLEEGIGKIEQGLKMYSKFQHEKSEILAENQALKERISAMEGQQESGEFERVKFLDGANWVSERVARETQGLRSDFKGVLNEFYDRNSGRESPVSSRRRQDWLITNTETLIAQFQHKLDTITQRVTLEYQSTS